MSLAPFGADRSESDPLTDHRRGIAQPLPDSMTFAPDTSAGSQVRLGTDGANDGRSLTEILEHQPGVDSNALNPLQH